MSFTLPNRQDAAYGPQAEPDAGDFDALVAGFVRTGVLEGCAVTAQVAPDMTVAVAAGTALENGVPQPFAGDDVALVASTAYPRIDLIVVAAGVASAVEGLAGEAPAYPSIPAGSVLLAAVYVPPFVGSISAAMILDKRVMLEDGERVPRDGSVLPVKLAAATVALFDPAGAADDAVADIPVDGAAATPSLRTLGLGAQQAAAGNDARFVDQRVPTDNSVTPVKLTAATVALFDAAGAAAAVAATIPAASNVAPPVIAVASAVGDVNVWARGNHTHGYGPDAARLSLANVFLAASAATVPVTVKGAAGQTANLWEARNSADTVLAMFNASGALRTPIVNVNTSGFGAGLSLAALDASTAGAILRGAAGQTADLTTWQNSAAVTLAGVAAGGSVYTSQRLTAGNAASSSLSTLFVATLAASEVAAIIRAKASQTADVQQWQDSTGAVGARIDSTLGFTVGTVSPTFLNAGPGASGIGSKQAAVVAGAATTVPLILRGAASQSANLTQWQNSAGSVQAFIRNDGLIGAPYLTNAADTGPYIAFGSVGMTQFARNPGDIPAGVNGAVAQTANLSEWRTSAATVLAAVNSVGEIIGANLRTGGFIASSASGKAYLQPNFDTGGMGVVTNGAANKGTVLRASASQTANLYEWQDSAATVLAKVRFDGLIAAPYFDGISGAGPFLSLSGTQIIAQPRSASQVPFTIKGVASQTADALQLQDSSGAVGLGATVFGGLTSNVGGSYPARWSVGAGTAGTIPLLARAVAAQTANLQEWQDSTSTALTYIGSDGISRSQGFRTLSGNSNAFGITILSGVLTAFGPGGNAGIIPVVVKHAAGQTTDDFQLRTSADVATFAITAAGLPKWALASNTQTTIGGAGAAAALPANPEKYFKVVDSDGTLLGFPAYKLV